MKIKNNCISKKIAEKEIAKIEKFADEVLNDYVDEFEVIIEECGDSWIYVPELDIKIVNSIAATNKAIVKVNRHAIANNKKFFILEHNGIFELWM